jgi:hypothetical protein
MEDKSCTIDELMEFDRQSDSRLLSRLLVLFGIFFFVFLVITCSSPAHSQATRKEKDMPKGKYYMPKPHANASGLRSFLVFNNS